MVNASTLAVSSCPFVVSCSPFVVSLSNHLFKLKLYIDPPSLPSPGYRAAALRRGLDLVPFSARFTASWANVRTGTPVAPFTK